MNDDTILATKGDVKRLEELLLAGFERINEQFGGMHERFARVNDRFTAVREDSNRILDVLVNVDKRLTEQNKNHQKRITVLEKQLATIGG